MISRCAGGRGTARFCSQQAHRHKQGNLSAVTVQLRSACFQSGTPRAAPRAEGHGERKGFLLVTGLQPFRSRRWGRRVVESSLASNRNLPEHATPSHRHCRRHWHRHRPPLQHTLVCTATCPLQAFAAEIPRSTVACCLGAETLGSPGYAAPAARAAGRAAVAAAAAGKLTSCMTPSGTPGSSS